jgi:hypothetical protein
MPNPIEEPADAEPDFKEPLDPEPDEQPSFPDPEGQTSS